MIQQVIPHNARYIPSVASFTAAFGVPTPGFYDFTNTAACKNVSVLAIQPNTIYFIDNIGIGGNLAGIDYSAAISTLPTIRFTKLLDNGNVYQKDIPLPTFAENRAATVFFHSDKGGDQLLLSMSGILAMTPALMGIASVSLYISCAIYAMDEKEYNAQYRDTVTAQYSERLRK